MMEENEQAKSGPPKRGFDLIEKLILDGEAPPHIRLAAAKGALPLSRLSLLRLKVFLKNDMDPSVKTEASKGLESIPREELLSLLREKKCHSSVLSYFASERKEDREFLEVIIQNVSTPDETLALIAETAPIEVAEIILLNEQRLISSPLLAASLERNPRLSSLARTKLAEWKEKFIKKEVLLAPAPRAEEVLEEEPAEIDVDAVIGDSFIQDGDEFESGPQDIRNVYRTILTMTVPEKVMRALRGTLAERRVLIRDSNKIVSLTVLENPRLSEQEVEIIAGSKNIDEEILREVGRSREWTKHYAVSSNLVKNPKTPPGISTSLIHRLTNTDLKVLQSDRNVPELIRAMAKKVLTSRTQPAAGLKKKK